MRIVVSIFSVMGLLWVGPVVADSADEILGSIDKNLNFETRYTRATMTVTKPRRTKVYELETWGRGMDTAATEFHSPRRDAGTKMLKKGGELRMYMPSIEKVQRISGHMLRQGMMGSDLSYEDLLQFTGWRELYTAKVEAEEACGEATCWKLSLTANRKDASYPTRTVWVDKRTRIPVRQELYALSGKLLKTWTMEAPQQFGARWYPTRMVLEDKLQDGTRTVLEFSDLEFEAANFSEAVFEQRWLER